MSKQIKFFTRLDIPSKKDKIGSDSRILTLGSCFSDYIGNRMADHYFDTLVNPFGTIFNPISIAKVLDMAMNGASVKKADLNMTSNRYFHYDFHSSFDSTSPEDVVKNVNHSIARTAAHLKKANFLILTFGTSIVYTLKSTKRMVSNCHKVPNHLFEKEILSIDFMIEAMLKLIAFIKQINPTIHLILTVSPIRHTKESLIKNSLSKSRLIDLCHRLVKAENNVSYFPSYEIMIDELRDYRFYKSDLIHPSDLAVDIIWTYFQDTYFDPMSVKKVQDIGKLILARNHQPFDPLSAEHLKFRKKQLENIDQLKKTYPEIDFSDFRDFFS